MIPDLIAIFVILVLCCAPLVLWIVGLHALARHPRLRLYLYRRQLYRRQENHSPSALEPFSSNQSMLLHWIAPANYLGDTSCRFNAHSPFLRCAVNPAGPCQNCPCYELSQHLSSSSEQYQSPVNLL